MPDGVQAALKVAAPSSYESALLAHEAEVLLALRQEWGVWVPALLAAGAGNGGASRVLATAFVRSSRELDPSTDRHLLPQLRQAVAAVHARGVAHSDVRRQNVLVQEGGAHKQRVWLIDWGFSALQATQQAMDEDVRRLLQLFDG
jgi:tRNA A-37 threonylcarbamoyl transferase component Bud32